MERKVTEEEIEQLHQFVKSRFVEFYDVELELVDHLANGIEIQWQENPELSFEEAKQIEFKKFGIFGFTGIVEKKVNELTNAYYQQSFNQLKAFFTLPKLAISVVLYLFVYQLLQLLSYDWIRGLNESFRSILFGIIIIQLIRLYIQRNKRRKNKEKEWLLYSVLFNLEVWPYYLLAFIGMPVIISSRLLWFCALIYTITILYIYVLKRIIVPKMQNDIEKQKNKILTI